MKRMRYILLTAAVGALCFEFGWLVSPGLQEAAPAMQIQEEQPQTIAQFRQDREQLRAMQRSQLNEMIHAADTDDALKGAARRKLLEINEASAAELNLEGIIRLRGWEDCVATVQADSVNILIPAEVITRQDSSVILELVCRETGVQGGNVKIIPINSAK